MKSLLHAYCLLLFLFTSVLGQAQSTPTWNWVQQIGGTGLDRGIMSASDASGSVYQTGGFANTAQVGTTTLSSISRDMYLVKYNASGGVQWVRQSRVQNTATGFGRAEGISIATDSNGNVYVSGNFAGAATFESTVLTATTGGMNTFIVKYNDQGTLLWALNSNGNNASSTTTASGLAVNANGDVFASGSFNGSVTFGSTAVLGQGGLDLFLVKVNASGTPQWLCSAGGNNTDYAGALAAGPNGSVYLSGGFSTVATFGPLTVTSRGSTDAFIALYDAQGSVQWAKSYGGPGTDAAGALAVAPNGDLYNVGYFQNTAAFGNTSLISFGLDDGYVMKCNAQGALLWVRQIGGTGVDGAYSASLSSAGILYIAGSFNGTASFDTQTRTSAGGDDIFIARYASTGALVWVDRCGGTGNEYDGGVACGANGTIYVGGQFTNTAQFGPLSLISRGLSDGFIASIQDNVLTATNTGRLAVQYSLHPNPVEAGSITLLVANTTLEQGTIDIIDVMGRIVQTIVPDRNQYTRSGITIDLSHLISGKYIMRYTTKSEIVSKPFIIL